MAKQKEGPTKSSIIREFLGKYPDAGPTEVCEKIQEAHPKLSIKPQEVSTLKSQERKKAGGTTKGRRKATAAPNGAIGSKELSGAVEKLAEAVNVIGKDKAKKLLEVID